MYIAFRIILGTMYLFSHVTAELVVDLYTTDAMATAVWSQVGPIFHLRGSVPGEVAAQ